jgi:hypothetical protein
LLGTFEPVEGAVIEQSCTDVGPDRPFIEAMVVFDVGDGGSWEGMEILYTAGSKTYLLEVAWRMTACGVDVADDFACEGWRDS